jgi:hypothetical protein
LVGLLLAAPVLLIALPFWIVAALTRVLSRWLEPEFVPWQQLIEFEPSIGWRPKANLDVHYLADRDPEVFHVVTDSDGWPGRATIAESELLVFGDSYAFGFGIDAEDSFAAPQPDLRTKAIGAPGYNMVQQLLLMQRLAPELAGKVIVWLVYYGNDLYDNLSPEMSGYRTPFLMQPDGAEEWELVVSHLSKERWTPNARREAWTILADLHSRTPLADRAFSACRFLIRLADDVCSGAGAKLVVVGIPTPRTMSPPWLRRIASHARSGQSLEPDLPDRELRVICEGCGVPFVAARGRLTASDYRPVDDHWNRRGHRKMSALLREIHRDHGYGRGGADARASSAATAER